MYWTEIYPQPQQYAFDKNSVCKGVIILHNFGSGPVSIFHVAAYLHVNCVA